MKKIKKLIRFFGIFLFACMLSVCMVMGIAIIIPKKKDQFAHEFKMEDTDKSEGANENMELNQEDSKM